MSTPYCFNCLERADDCSCGGEVFVYGKTNVLLLKIKRRVINLPKEFTKQDIYNILKEYEER